MVVNKKGFLRILEAVLAILIVIGFLFVLSINRALVIIIVITTIVFIYFIWSLIQRKKY